MGIPEAATTIKASGPEAAVQLRLPSTCVYCPSPRVGWKELRTRTATVLVEGQSDYLTDLPVRRAMCGECRRSWTVQTPGILPRKHYQPCVVAQAVSTYLFEPEASEATVAAQFDCSRRQVGRWVRWVAALSTPADLQARVVEAADEPLLPHLPVVQGLERKAPTAHRRTLLVLAALLLALFEFLGHALALAPPGLRAVLLRLSEGWRPLAPYQAPALPILARRGALAGHEMFLM